jgi:ribosomal protein S1
MQVAVIDVDTVNNKVRLSRKSVLEKSAQDEFDEYKKSVKTSSESAGKLSLGHILKAKLKEKNNKV